MHRKISEMREQSCSEFLRVVKDKKFGLIMNKIDDERSHFILRLACSKKYACL